MCFADVWLQSKLVDCGQHVCVLPQCVLTPETILMNKVVLTPQVIFKSDKMIKEEIDKRQLATRVRQFVGDHRTAAAAVIALLRR